MQSEIALFNERPPPFPPHLPPPIPFLCVKYNTVSTQTACSHVVQHVFHSLDQMHTCISKINPCIHICLCKRIPSIRTTVCEQQQRSKLFMLREDRSGNILHSKSNTVSDNENNFENLSHPPNTHITGFRPLCR